MLREIQIPRVAKIASLAVLLLVGSTVYGQNSEKPAATPAKKPEAAAKEQTVKPSQSDVFRKFFITGELRAANAVQISVPRIRSSFASVVTYLAPEGSQVKQGERLVEFDSSTLTSQRSEYERRLDESKLTIEKTKADLEAQRCDLLNAVAQAEANLKVAGLYAKTPAELLAANTFQKYQLDLERAQLALTKAKEQLDNFDKSRPTQMALVEINRAQAEIDLKKIEGDVALLFIAAPQDGIVIYGDNWASNRKIQVGDNIFPGMPVVELPDLSSMQVIGLVYDTELSLLSKGMRCTFSLDAAPGPTYQGVILSLTSVASRKGFASQQKVFRAVIQPDKVDPTAMKPGMTARVMFGIKLADKATTIPREYLGLDSEGRYYVLKKTGKPEAARQIVEVGAFGDALVEIRAGLSSNDSLMPVQKVWEE
ncbi:MAG: HlyD family efflux transporter periplasmic adaptor subunit [Acidobacteria bacterium]|nr:MAG: HlyD family efflux transporter periplasmic adaptor subunit [Acidobacteriota bacterium]